MNKYNIDWKSRMCMSIFCVKLEKSTLEHASKELIFLANGLKVNLSLFRA